MSVVGYNVTINKEELAELPQALYTGDIKIVATTRSMKAAVAKLRKSPIIGFDTETRPSFRKGKVYNVALLQLSTRDCCYLFRLNRLGLRKEVMDLLEDERLLKVGLSIKDDFMNLNKLKELHPEGFVDLQSYVKQFGIADNSLQRIYGILFGERISKGQRLTNWEAEQLSEAQMQYAALDALACIKIYDYLSAGNFNPNKSEYLRPIIVEDEGEMI